MKVFNPPRQLTQPIAEEPDLASEVAARQRLSDEAEDMARATEMATEPSVAVGLPDSWRHKKLPPLPRKRSLSPTEGDAGALRRPRVPARAEQTTPHQEALMPSAQAAMALAEVIAMVPNVSKATAQLARARRAASDGQLQALVTSLAKLRSAVAELGKLQKEGQTEFEQNRVIEELSRACRFFLPEQLESLAVLSETQADRLGTFANQLVMAENKYYGRR